MFAVPFDEIALIVGRTPDATRQLASRARRRVRGVEPGNVVDRARQRRIVDAFLNAARAGEFDALLALLDPDVVLRADDAAMRTGAPGDVVGAPAVAGTFSGRAQAARLALVDGVAALVWSRGGAPQVVFAFTIAGDAVVAIDMVADPDHLSAMEIELVAG
jgi:RNA polymerase sigma-70 factor (ECF subfamily)